MGINELIQIGSRIKEIRVSKGITQKDMAAKLKLNRSTYSNYENNIREPNLDTINTIAEALQVDISELIGQSITTISPDKEYLFEQLIRKLGYEICGDQSEGYLVIKYKGKEYEINESDLDKLYNGSMNFIAFQLQELINNSRRIGKTKEGE